MPTVMLAFLESARLASCKSSRSPSGIDISQDDGKGGLSLRGVAVTTKTATTAETVTRAGKGAGVKGAGVANCRIFRSAVPSVVVWSILLVSLSGVKKKL